MYCHLLVPIDDSDLSVAVVGNAVQLARAVGARITFFNGARGPADAQIGVSTHSRAVPGNVATALVGKAAEVLARAEAAARAFGVPCASRYVLAVQLGDALVDLARSEGCDLIVMAPPDRSSRPGTAAVSDTFGAVSSAGISVLMPSIAGPRHAVAVIRNEHRFLAAVLHAWIHLLDAACRGGSAAEPQLMCEIASYVESFTLTLHEPKEDEHLFGRLRARTSAVNAELDELQRQHVRARQRIAELVSRVALLGASSRPTAVAATRDLDEAVRAYASTVWDHLGREEGVILPAAQRYLTEDDWAAIDTAFMENRAPGGGADTEAEVLRLFSLMVDATPHLP